MFAFATKVQRDRHLVPCAACLGASAEAGNQYDFAALGGCCLHEGSCRIVICQQ